jgi:hypothetical protein
VKAAVVPFRVVRRNSSVEPMTPQLRALINSAATSDPYGLSLCVHLLIGADSPAAAVEAYFTPKQRKLLKRQQAEAAGRRAKEWAAKPPKVNNITIDRDDKGAA